MTPEAVDVLLWSLGAIGALGAAIFGVWWKVEHRQNAKIDECAKRKDIDDFRSSLSDFKKQNDASHQMIRDKIERTEATLTAQHWALRDKIEEIWKHVVKGKD